MPDASTTKTDTSTTVGHESAPASAWRIRRFAVLGPHTVQVEFNDGLTGTLDMGALVTAPDGGVFTTLADPEVFAAVKLDHGALLWPGDIDLAPDAMYREIKRLGHWVVS